jgi:hypothetical protein
MTIVRAWKSEPGEAKYMGRFAEDDKEELRLAAFGSRLIETCCRAPLGRSDEGVRAYVVLCLTPRRV